MRARGGEGLWLRLVGRLVPPGEREDWTDEWRGELGAHRREGASRVRRIRFALGALPHALSLRPARGRGGDLGPDLRFALRTLVRRPAFTGVAALTLALGITVNAALFSLVDGLLLQPPPGVESPERMVQLARSYDSAPRWDAFAYPIVERLRDADHLFDGVAGYGGRAFLIGEGSDAELVGGAWVTGDYFDVLGLRPAVGRLLQPADDAEGAPAVLVLSHGLWTRRFGGDPTVIGRTLRVGGRLHEIVGVAPPAFRGVDNLGSAPEVLLPSVAYTPLAGPDPTGRSTWGFSWLSVAARLRPGIDAETARAALDAVSTALREASTENGDIRVVLAEGLGLSPEERGEALRLAGIMAVIAGLVLLLTCANVGGLFLARAVDREPEFALRRTLGAGGGRIARQLLTESAGLATLATLLSVPLLHLVGGHLGRLVPATVSVSFAPGVRGYGALLVLGIGAGVLFGGGPALLAAHRAPARGLGSSRTATGSATTRRVRNALVMGQVAVSLALLCGAGLLARSVRAALSARPGLDPAGVLAASLDLDLTGRYDDPAARAVVLDRLLVDLRNAPTVEAAALATVAPFWGPFARSTRHPLDGGPEAGFEAGLVYADAAWFDLLDIRVIDGRGFADDEEPEPVALVNESLARLFWPDGAATGKLLAGAPPLRVVGVVADARLRSLRNRPLPTVYEPLSQAGYGRVVLHVRAREGGGPEALTGEIREAVRALDPGLPVTRVVDLQDRMAGTLGETRDLGAVVGAFALLALVLATLGLYASVAYAVARRTRDLAVRVAIGARPGAVFADVVRRGAALAVAGAALGVALAAAVGRALEGTLYGVPSFDAPTLAGVAVLQIAVAIAATAVPARRATRVDPARALREEA